MPIYGTMTQSLMSEHALFLDLDGTLLNFAATPEDVIIPEGLETLLMGLSRQREGALAILSGRRLGQIDDVTGHKFPAGAEHGFIIRDADGTIHEPVPTSANRKPWRAALEDAAARHPGVRIEPKTSGLVVHFRQAPDAGPELRRRIAALIADAPEIEVLPANMAWEIRPRGVGKGRALEWFMDRPPFAGRKPVFVGDDTTDEEAILAANALGGRGLHVHRDFDGTPEAVLAWLREELGREGL